VIARVPDAAFAVSEDLKRHLVSEGFDSRAVEVLHNGIEPGPPRSPQARADARRLLSVAPGECVIATVARLDPVKDLTSLVDAFRLVRERRSDARLVIVGEGSERSAIETLVERHGLAPAVTLLGHREDARQLLAGVDIYVNCSTFEGISLTILEAMAAALPVVATHVGGNPEIVDMSTGRLVPPRDPARLADALIALADAPALRTELGLSARARIERDFSLDRMVQQYHHVYRSATSCAASQA
jgi:glycosyltransferase involved in cell wall biosynthesis